MITHLTVSPSMMRALLLELELFATIIDDDDDDDVVGSSMKAMMMGIICIMSHRVQLYYIEAELLQPETWELWSQSTLSLLVSTHLISAQPDSASPHQHHNNFLKQTILSSLRTFLRHHRCFTATTLINVLEMKIFTICSTA